MRKERSERGKEVTSKRGKKGESERGRVSEGEGDTPFFKPLRSQPYSSGTH